MNEETYYTIDPPEGWRFEFPKTMTLKEYMYHSENKSFKQWCIDNGYPKKVADSYGEYFHIGVSKVTPKMKKETVNYLYELVTIDKVHKVHATDLLQALEKTVKHLNEKHSWNKDVNDLIKEVISVSREDSSIIF